MTYLTTPNQFIQDQQGQRFAYREVGTGRGLPLVLLNHLSATLDNWDPALIDLISQQRRVIVFNNRGVGFSDGKVPTTIEQMVADCYAFITAMQLTQFDLLGLSMGGFIAQAFTLKYPSSVNHLILVGTGPQGDSEIAKVGRITTFDLIRSFLTHRDVKEYLFFTRTPQGKQAGKAFINRLKQREIVEDKAITLATYRRQLIAIKQYAHDQPANLAQINQPTLIVNGDHDRMVPVNGSYELHERILNSQLKLYPDAGHMALFQNPNDFAALLAQFLNH
ncbi:alpha/beta hydrolase [Latilactobacillus curvatus]|uniref:Alpha beta hydrolase fold family protein n=1 Tax=Latilactobacillus curvatus JCM 1096 = DSM 20019 TaxID=1293592 RepID=A0AAJ0LFA7_LATCU|nr:alpha/beta hydrolase [Latilactobacillus curvatus]KRK92863.1 alpha beta hydrolase fold family protein [Latilactobacillus curvatus JCM 1096 = DSM 20019]MCP8848228.1 alpha/beta hydrolase [Latilactobacillus curvatus]MCP8862718.1 alpha/beta hydrolase [Latilactobacillus curvatus]MCP8864201.1 alpha/beta hydrolase [Latilactobacillus curvatus]MCP8866200.1 alpha/beta hydrolase [Latilactobacillus curvatus]